MGNRIRPNGHRAKLAIASIWAVISMNLIGLCLSFIIYFVFTQLIANSGSNYYETVSFITSFVSFAYVAALITSIVMFLHWFRRAYYNLNVVTDECVYEDSWAVKAWFIPFLNLYRPYQMMKELFEKTGSHVFEKYMLTEKDFNIKDLKTSTLKWWWIINIILIIIYTFQFFLSFFISFSTFGMIGYGFIGTIKAGLLMASGIMLISIIKNYQRAAELLNSDTTESID